jgi:citrate synthase
VLAHSGTLTGRGADKVEELIGENVDRTEFRRRLELVRNYGTKLYGFNHPLYPRGDPRALALIELARRLRNPPRAAENAFWFLEQAEQQCHAYPGMAVGLATLALALKLPRHGALAVWTVGRAAGLVAHVIEQRAAGYMLRPRARFVGA